MRLSYRLVVLGGLAGVAASSSASAQTWSDNASPPINVPTTPVPQGPTPPPPPPAKPPPPKPAAAPPSPKSEAPKPADASKPAGGGGEDTPGPKYNNEGVFKVSGAKGSGVVTGTKAKGKKGGEAAAPPQPAGKKAGKAKSTATIAQWPGFRATEDGGSELMVEFSQNPAAPTEHRAAGSITYVFKGAHVIKSNNQNPLLTVHFNTPVTSARLLPKKGELHFVVDLRAGANVTPSSGLRASSDGDGQQFFVKFPSGSWLPPGAENEDIAPAPTQKLKDKGKKDDAKDDAKPAAPPTESGSKTGPAP